jgi:PIN domain nuclease of toxin-antitoxin system
VIYLDTHVIVWLYAGKSNLFPPDAISLIEENDLVISPAVILELQYLKEIDRISSESSMMISTLKASIGLQVCSLPFQDVIASSLTQTWTRDPFDRIIVGNAAVTNQPLLTKDKTILKHYSNAFWTLNP